MSGTAKRALEVVIANRQDDVSWLSALGKIPKKLYDYGPQDAVANSPPVVELAYLRHIVENYDRLAEFTVFLPSNAVARYPWIIDRVRCLPNNLSFHAFGKELVTDELSKSPGGQHDLFSEVCTDWSCEVPDVLAYHAGSMFAASRDRITSRPRDVYQRTLERASARSEVAELLEGIWHLAFSSSSSRQGIVTAGDSPIFRDLQFLIQSLQSSYSGPVVIYDLGMSTSELQWCLNQPNVTCRPLPPMTAAMARYVGMHRWQPWLKPTYIADAPFDRILWLDADCVVLDPVEELFERLDEGPVLLPEVCPGGGRNHARLYELLPIADAQRHHAFEINNGVIGLDRHRDRELLAAWLYAVDWAITNDGRRHLMRWYDQGAFLWAILKTHAETHISSEQKWNFPAKPVSIIIRHAIENRLSLLDAIRYFHPEASIVHWYGLYKLSIALNNELHELFTTGIVGKPLESRL
jgi:hypothetical protein